MVERRKIWPLSKTGEIVSEYKSVESRRHPRPDCVCKVGATMTTQKKAALQGGGPCQNTHPHSSNRRLHNAIAQTIVGGREGDQFIRALRESYREPDALATRLQEIADDAARTRGFCRALQKFIERGTE